jgi:hypothetical protein
LAQIAMTPQARARMIVPILMVTADPIAGTSARMLTLTAMGLIEQLTW